MHRHWREYGPPTYMAVAAYLGMSGTRPAQDRIQDPDDLAVFLANVPGAARSAAGQD